LLIVLAYEGLGALAGGALLVARPDGLATPATAARRCTRSPSRPDAAFYRLMASL